MSTTATQNKVDATTKKAKAPAVPAGALTNLGPKADPFDTSDPFENARGTPSIEAAVVKTDKIHIRLQQRNGRKTLTTIQGLPDKFDPKKLLKAMKKEFACNGTVVSSADSDEEDAPAPAAKANDFGKVLQLQGDQRIKSKEFLIASGIVPEKEAKERIVVHGY
ncbi:translation initiation factor SUI1-domain-containing protein [Papiliotrema laurentii]|uniref:Translation initiation factor SUI1-domain-containing protein n=1 Tax=Papiliotrema laurentii TaxID=5418 RepID=A0AAD9L677_PAPLA|nr:translation initiation factor SUI1-domain-containing protein [Papiliotrema laurentii]